MLIDGNIDFNETYIASKTKAAFVGEFKEYEHIFPGDPNRERKLEDVWNQAKAQTKQDNEIVAEGEVVSFAPKGTKSAKITKTAKVGKTSEPKAEATEPATPANNDGSDTGN